MSKKEGRIVATGVNPQGVRWKEISFVDEDKQEKKTKEERRRKLKS